MVDLLRVGHRHGRLGSRTVGHRGAHEGVGANEGEGGDDEAEHGAGWWWRVRGVRIDGRSDLNYAESDTLKSSVRRTGERLRKREVKSRFSHWLRLL